MSDRKTGKPQKIKSLIENESGKPSQPRPKKPRGFNESHPKKCQCQACLMAAGCPFGGSFRNNVVEK